MTKREARRLMYDADRDRARIAYRGVDFERWTNARIDRTIAKNEATPEYTEAQARFKKYCAIVDDDRGPIAIRSLL